MNENSPENGPQIPPMPDIKDTHNLRVWMKKNIKKPPLGYDDMRHPDGTPLNPDEQIDTYIQQTIDVIEFKKARNHPEATYEPLKESLQSQLLPQEPPTSPTT